MLEETYEVFALKYAERSDRTRADSFLFEDDHASEHPMDYFIWLIRNDTRSIRRKARSAAGPSSARPGRC